MYACMYACVRVFFLCVCMECVYCLWVEASTSVTSGNVTFLRDSLHHATICATGSCASVLSKNFRNGFKDEELLATILFEALKGLEYLHKDGKIHRYTLVSRCCVTTLRMA